MSEAPFKTKKFDVSHHKSTMKVGTDAILLGLWCEVFNDSIILDAGTGCGIIAMILTSKSDASVVGLDSDGPSLKEAALNFRESSFSKSLLAEEGDFIDYTANTSLKYDLVVSNPPFFSTGLKSPSVSRQKARHASTLSTQNLCKGAHRILSKEGRLCVIIPFDQKNEFYKVATNAGFHLRKMLIIFPKENTEPNRIILDFSMKTVDLMRTYYFTIRNSDNSYSDQYKDLTKDLLWI